MLQQAIEFITTEMNAIFDADTDTVAMDIGPENVAYLDAGTESSTDDIRSKVLLTLVNIEEEKTLKNANNYVRQGNVLRKLQPALYLNLYLLFSCGDKSYKLALGRIGKVIELFQRQNVFVTGSTRTPMPVGLEKLIFDFATLSFEQQNHLWGMLGGKQLPAVMYKVRLVTILDPQGQVSDVISSLHLNEDEN